MVLSLPAEPSQPAQTETQAPGSHRKSAGGADGPQGTLTEIQSHVPALLTAHETEAETKTLLKPY